MTGSPPRAAPLLGFGSETRRDARPGRGPAVAAGDRSQGDEWFNVRAGPVHATALQSRFDHELVGALGAAAADRVTGRLKCRVLHLRQALGEVHHGSITRLRG